MVVHNDQIHMGLIPLLVMVNKALPRIHDTILVTKEQRAIEVVPPFLQWNCNTLFYVVYYCTG